MVYTPRNPPIGLFDTNPELALWLQDEFRNIAQSGNDTPEVRFTVLHNPPAKPRPGQTVYADGTDWNPGEGEGLYTFVDDAWQRNNNDGLATIAYVDESFDNFDEGGDWTPELFFDETASPGIGYDEQVGTWRREGKLIHINGLIVLNDKGSGTGSAQLFGMPFPVSGDDIVTVFKMHGGGMLVDALPSLDSYQPLSWPGDGFIRLYGHSQGNNYDLTDGNFQAGSAIVLSGTYIHEPP